MSKTWSYVPTQNIPATATAVTTEEQNNGSGNQSTVRNSWDYAAGLGREILGLPNLPGSDYSDKSNAFKYGYSVGNRAMPLTLNFEGLRTPVSSAPEFAVGYNGTLAQTVAVDAWKSGYLGSTIINASTNNSNSGDNEADEGSSNPLVKDAGSISKNTENLRTWAQDNGWVQQNTAGGVEQWGVRNADGTFSWRLKLKPEASTREGLGVGSNQPRFDARLDDKGTYINPFTGETGGRGVGTHIPLGE